LLNFCPYKPAYSCQTNKIYGREGNHDNWEMLDVFGPLLLLLWRWLLLPP